MGGCISFLFFTLDTTKRLVNNREWVCERLFKGVAKSINKSAFAMVSG